MLKPSLWIEFCLYWQVVISTVHVSTNTNIQCILNVITITRGKCCGQCFYINHMSYQSNCLVICHQVPMHCYNTAHKTFSGDVQWLIWIDHNTSVFFNFSTHLVTDNRCHQLYMLRGQVDKFADHTPGTYQWELHGIVLVPLLKSCEL